MGPADSDRISRVPPYSGLCYEVFTYMYGIFTLYDQVFQNVPFRIILHMMQSYYPTNAETIVVWAVPRSLAATGGITVVLFSCRYLDVSVPCVCLPYGIVHLQCTGLSHSETCGSEVICTYPQLIAAYHVLHRL